MSADPLAVHAAGQADLNVYAYVHGSLLRATDPVGLDKLSADTAIETGPGQVEAPTDTIEPSPLGSQGSTPEEKISTAVDTMVERAAPQKSVDLSGLTEGGFSFDPHPEIHRKNVGYHQAQAKADRPVESEMSPVDIAGPAIVRAGVGLGGSLVGMASSRLRLSAPSLAAEAERLVVGQGEGEIALAFKPGGMGHNKIGIRTDPEEEMQWFHMTRDPVPAGKSPVLASPRGEFGPTHPPDSRYLMSSVQVSGEQAHAALGQALRLEGRGQMWYVLSVRDCASTTRSVLSAGGFQAPTGTFSPAATFRWFQGVSGQ